MSKTSKLFVLAICITALLIPGLVSAKGVKRTQEPYRHYIAETTQTSPSTQAIKDIETTSNAIEQIATDCNIPATDKTSFSGNLISIMKKSQAANSELFDTKIIIQNTGNQPWFSSDSGCSRNIVNLGTDNVRDRQSPFYYSNNNGSNWLNTNRIKMETKRVDPGAIATFTFRSQAPSKDGYYREIYTPVVEGIQWIDTAKVTSDIQIGSTQIDQNKIELLKYIDKSGDLSSMDLTGEKSIIVSLSKQHMWLKIGDTVIKEFVVSSGKRSTPTPRGTYKILEKKEVKVGAKRPHYIMPKWMMFRAGGYGIHALPSLANDRGVFWREALSHIGSPRSHGCIRLLPADAEYAYNFGDVGTTVIVQK